MLKAQRVQALGAMSGTSFDGLDVALLETDGQRIFAFGPTEYLPYTPAEAQVLRKAAGQWSGPDVDAAEALINEIHQEFLPEFPAELIGFHGQTLAHDPENKRTFQIGDGAALADTLGVPVVWDFRSADMKLGGQGAPLVPFYHHVLARHFGFENPVAFLNLGGVGNITFVDPVFEKPESAGALLAFDTGPANAPINDLMQRRFGKSCDLNGELAAKGTADQSIIDAFLNHGYFYKIPPKSLDRNDFLQELSACDALSDADAAATLTACAVAAVTRAMTFLPRPVEQVFVSGGGRHNATLMHMLAAQMPCAVAPVEDLGLNGDALEAQAFAFLAVRVARGLPTTCPGTTGIMFAVGGGTISKPSVKG